MIEFQLESLNLIYYTEMILFLISLVLLSFEFSILRPVIKKKNTLYILGFLFAHISVYISRIIGIGSNSPLIRQYVSSVMGFFACIFMITWGSQMANLNNRITNVSFFSIFVGMLSFIFGRIINQESIEGFGLFLIMLTLIILLVNIFRYIFTKSPYIRARQRIFVMAFSFVILIFFEGLGVIYMGEGNFNLAAICFLIEIPFRFGITLSIYLPNSLVNILSKIIK